MSTINMNEINGSNRLNDIGGYAPTEARFDVLYMAARRQHCEAMRRAEMSRLARSITQTNAAARTTRRAQNPLAAIAGRIGR